MNKIFAQVREFMLKALEEKLPKLEEEKATLEAQLSSGTLAGDALLAASKRYGALQEELDEAEMRWLELQEITAG